MKPVLVAVVCSEAAAALLVRHRDFTVVFSALSGTVRPAVERAPAGDDSEVVAMLLDYQQVAAALRLSERKVRQMVASGELPAVSVGRARRVRTADLLEYVGRLGDPEVTTK